MDLLFQELLTECAKHVWFYQHVELHFSQKLALHGVEFAIVQNGEKLGQTAVTYRFVLPHLVGQQERCEKQRPPRECMKRYVRALLEPAQVDDANDERGHAENALVQNAEDK